MKENQSSRQGFHGWLISLVSALLAIYVVLICVNYQYPYHPYCKGLLGAGFPVIFICDDWGGGSPTSSWNKIDYIDVINGGIKPAGLLIDFLIYFVPIWIILLKVSSIFHKGMNHYDLGWVAFISIGFIFGFLCAFLMFQSGSLSFGDIQSSTPTPLITATSTPLRTVPPIITPIYPSP